MSKIRLRQNKETLIGLGISAGIAVLFVVNLAVIIPALRLLYQNGAEVTGVNPINTQAVNEAIEHLERR